MNNTLMTTGANPMLEDLQFFLNENFDFRYNVLTDMPECKTKNTTTYRMIDKRMMNSLIYKAMMEGIECKDADVKRFLFSDQIATHHPFKDYLDTLPEWDGTDRVTLLAAPCVGQGDVAQWIPSLDVGHGGTMVGLSGPMRQCACTYLNKHGAGDVQEYILFHSLAGGIEGLLHR